MAFNTFRKKIFSKIAVQRKKLILENALEMIYEFGCHFLPKRDSRAIFGLFQII